MKLKVKCDLNGLRKSINFSLTLIIVFNLMNNPEGDRSMKELPYLNDKQQILLTVLVSLCLVLPLYCRCAWADLNFWVIGIHFLNIGWISYLVIQIIQWATSFLDSRYSWENYRSKRLLFQFLLGMILPLVFAFGVVWISVVLLKVRIGIAISSRYSVLVVLLMVFCLNLVFGLWHFIAIGLQSAKTIAPVFADHILVERGNGLVKVLILDVAYLYKNRDDVVIVLTNKELLLTPEPLKHFQDLLDPRMFFRVNRQFIIARHAYKGHEKIQPSGKLLVTLDPPVSGKVVVSRDVRKEFEKWIVGEGGVC